MSASGSRVGRIWTVAVAQELEELGIGMTESCC